MGNNQELLDLKFLFIKGTQEQNVISIQNIYSDGEYEYQLFSDEKVLKKYIPLNNKARGYKIKSIIPGHGHEGSSNCYE